MPARSVRRLLVFGASAIAVGSFGSLVVASLSQRANSA